MVKNDQWVKTNKHSTLYFEDYTLQKCQDVMIKPKKD